MEFIAILRQAHPSRHRLWRLLGMRCSVFNELNLMVRLSNHGQQPFSAAANGHIHLC
jgi:hypothetical protein